jgi:hypothetical protein
MEATALRILIRTGALVVLLYVVAIHPHSASGQAFQNLGFEQSVVSPSNVVSIPGWRFSGSHDIPDDDVASLPIGIHLGSDPTGIQLGSDPLQRAVYSIWPTPPPPPPPALPGPLFQGTFFTTPVLGHFSIAMRSQRDDFSPGSFPWMEQTGIVPAGAQSIRLRSSTDYAGRDIFPDGFLAGIAISDGWSLTIDGVPVPVVPLGGRYSGDISAFAGTVRTMRVSVNREFGMLVPNGYFGQPPILKHLSYKFDAFHFSPLAFNQTPEPGSAMLLFVGMMSLIRRRGRIS